MQAWSAHLPAEPGKGRREGEKRHGDPDKNQIHNERRERGQRQGG